jgi:hypothetical protein
MVGGRLLKKLTCLLGPKPYVQPGTSSTVGPKRQSKLVRYLRINHESPIIENPRVAPLTVLLTANLSYHHTKDQ